MQNLTIKFFFKYFVMCNQNLILFKQFFSLNSVEKHIFQKFKSLYEYQKFIKHIS